MYKSRISKKITIQRINKILGHKDWELFEEEDIFSVNDKVSILCKKHDYFCRKTVKSIKNKDVIICPFCQNERITYICLHLIKRVCQDKGLEFLNMVEINPVDDYEKITAKDLFWCKCPSHEPFKTSFDTLYNGGHGCPTCAHEKNGMKLRLSDEEIIKRFKQVGYQVQQVYRKESLTYIDYICEKHPDTIQTIQLSNFINGCGCRFCSESKGEKAVKAFLKQNKIDFVQQKTFPDCKNIRELPFDFYLPKYNICIEYQGKQHYEPIYHWFGRYMSHEKVLENFYEGQKRDNIKREYCKNNNIPLIEIPYTEKHTEQYLKEKLEEYNVEFLQ